MTDFRRGFVPIRMYILPYEHIGSSIVVLFFFLLEYYIPPNSPTFLCFSGTYLPLEYYHEGVLHILLISHTTT